MMKKTLKYVIVALTGLISCTQAAGCPTCLGRLRIGDKEPFFKRYRPRSRSIYAKKRDLLREAMLQKKMGESRLNEEFKNRSHNKNKEKV